MKVHIMGLYKIWGHRDCTLHCLAFKGILGCIISCLMQDHESNARTETLGLARKRLSHAPQSFKALDDLLLKTRGLEVLII